MFRELFRVTVISLPCPFCCPRVVVSMHPRYLVSQILPSFLDTYSLWMSSLRCWALYFVISFLVQWSICWSSSLVHFNNGYKYLTNEDSPGFYPFDENPAADCYFILFEIFTASSSVSDSHSPKCVQPIFSFLQDFADLFSFGVCMIPIFFLVSTSRKKFSKNFRTIPNVPFGWFIVSSLSPCKFHFLFCCLISIFALILLVLMVLYCAVSWRESVYLLKSCGLFSPFEPVYFFR